MRNFTLLKYFQVKSDKWNYLNDIHNLIDIAIQLLSYITIIFNIYRNLNTSHVTNSLTSSSSAQSKATKTDSITTTENINFDHLAYYQSIIDQLNAIILFFSWIKVT